MPKDFEDQIYKFMVQFILSHQKMNDRMICIPMLSPVAPEHPLTEQKAPTSQRCHTDWPF